MYSYGHTLDTQLDVKVEGHISYYVYASFWDTA